MSDSFISIVLLLSVLMALGAGFFLMLKINKVKELEISVHNLQQTLDEMEEQAKLVVRTDIELNKAQEELDKKISGLYTLQKLSRTISSTLEESQVFRQIEHSAIESLGFISCLVFLWETKKQIFKPHLAIGYNEQDLLAINESVNTAKASYQELINTDNTLSSLSLSNNAAQKNLFLRIFKNESFIFCPLVPKDGDPGFMLLGAHKNALLNESDVELVKILAHQISQALENARLFEKTWQAQQALEKRVEERTRELSKALEEVNRISRRKNDFVSNVSHELRTPLTSIKGYASILLSGKLGNVPEEVQKRLEKINKHSDELVQFVNDLLDIARIESGRVSLHIAPLQIKNIAEEVADMLAIQCKEKQINLSIQSPDAPTAALGDYGQIKRVFINLINNAIKYTPNQGKITVHIKTRPENIQVDIQDTGCGIPEEAQDKLFVEFYRVDNTLNQTIKGTGLGLAMVKHIIEVHKGTLWLRSQPGVGSTFSFTVPKSE